MTTTPPAGPPTRLLRRSAITSVLAAATLGATLQAQSAPTPSDRVGLLIVAHGADSGWNANVRQTAAQVRWQKGPVEVAFLMGSEAESAGWSRGVGKLHQQGATRIVAVPLMVSTHGSHVEQIRFYAGERASLPAELHAMGHGHEAHHPNPVPVVTTPALDDATELGDALFERWQALPGADRKRPLMLIAHGPNDSASAVLWERNIARTAAHLISLVAPHPTRVALLRDDAPAPVRAAAIRQMRDTISALAVRSNDSVTVLPVLISTGTVNTVKIPADIAGLPVRYRSVGLAPSAALARWIERIADARLRGAATPPHN